MTYPDAMIDAMCASVWGDRGPRIATRAARLLRFWGRNAGRVLGVGAPSGRDVGQPCDVCGKVKQ